MQAEEKTAGAPQRVAPSRKTRLMNAFSMACAGSSLICDGYQNNVMTAVNLVLKQEYKNVYTTGFTSRVSNGMLVGQIIGMLLFGLTCDIFSRKNSIIFTTILMLIGSILAAAAHGSTTHGMFWMMAIGQGVCGVGVGGEFPTAASMTAEAANDNERKGKNKRSRNRGWQYILITNMPLQFGGPLTMSIFLIVWEAASGTKHLSTIWRVMFGIGCVWPVLVFLLRWKLVNSDMFKKNKFVNFNVPWLLVFRYYWKRLLGTCFTFLLYDWIVKSNGTMSGLIIKSVVKGGDTKKTAEWQLLLGTIQMLGIPVGALLCEPLGRKRVMMIGFLGFVVFGIAIGASWYQIKEIVPLFVVLYGLFAAVGHMGPGCMMGLLSTEAYATGVRASLYGLSSAFGRAGGAIGIQAFGPIADNMGQRWTFLFSAIIGAVAIVWAWLFIPDLNSDDLEFEDQRFEAYLRAHGYNGKIGFSDSDSDYSFSDSEDSKKEALEKQDSDSLSVETKNADQESYVVTNGALPDSSNIYSRSEKYATRSRLQRLFSLDPLNI